MMWAVNMRATWQYGCCLPRAQEEVGVTIRAACSCSGTAILMKQRSLYPPCRRSSRTHMHKDPKKHINNSNMN
eukprot:5155438-Amphidinium_carterae.1